MKKEKKYNYMNLSQETIDRINKAIDKSLNSLEDIPDPFDNQVSECDYGESKDYTAIISPEKPRCK